jgi:RHS repeat-associated protein
VGPGNLLRLAFTYATATTDNGNLTSQTITAPGFSQTQYYGYDGVNRLKAASEGAALVGGTTCPTTQSWCQEYGFDTFGNRWVSFSNRTLHMATPTSAANFNAATNRLTGTGITYDNAGNLTAHPFLTPGAGGGMVYNASNKMTQFTATGVSVSYRYDAQERRVRQDSAGQTTIWVYDAFGQLAAEYSTNLTMVQGVYYRTTDHLGSTRIVTNQTAQVVQRRDFFPFGEAIPADSSHGNRHLVLDGGQPTYNASLAMRQQFTGQQRDNDTTLDYFWARTYSPPCGRFLQIDPGQTSLSLVNPQTWNRFAYVNNSPVIHVDPNGEYTALAVAGVACGTGVAGATIEYLVQTYEIGEGIREDYDSDQIVFVGVGTALGAAVASSMPFLYPELFKGQMGYWIYSSAAGAAGELTSSAVQDAFGVQRATSRGEATVSIGADQLIEAAGGNETFDNLCAATSKTQAARLFLRLAGETTVKSLGIGLGYTLTKNYQQWLYDSWAIYEDWYDSNFGWTMTWSDAFGDRTWPIIRIVVTFFGATSTITYPPE